MRMKNKEGKVSYLRNKERDKAYIFLNEYNLWRDKAYIFINEENLCII